MLLQVIIPTQRPNPCLLCVLDWQAAFFTTNATWEDSFGYTDSYTVMSLMFIFMLACTYISYLSILITPCISTYLLINIVTQASS